MWTTSDIAGKPATLFEPSRTRFAALYLHAIGQENLAHPDAVPFTPLLEQHGIACVCPAGGYTWWSDRIDPEYDPNQSAERYLLGDVVPWMQARWPAQRSFGLFGISMGGQGALRLAFKEPELFPVVAAIAPAIEYHQYYGLGFSLDAMYSSKEACRQDTAGMHIHPSRQPPSVLFTCDPDDTDWYRGCDRLHEKMLALGAAHECDLTTGGGAHTWAYFNAMAPRVMQFLADGLSVESRRLL